MSRITLKTLIDKEINFLNERIDKKIQRGKSYYRDAQKHQALVAHYHRLERRKDLNFSLRPLFTT